MEHKVAMMYTYGGDMKWTIRTEKKSDVPIFIDTITDAETAKRVCENRLDEYVN
jgi:hypothetical protein